MAQTLDQAHTQYRQPESAIKLPFKQNPPLPVLVKRTRNDTCQHVSKIVRSEKRRRVTASGKAGERATRASQVREDRTRNVMDKNVKARDAERLKHGRKVLRLAFTPGAE
ncbi:hypothetical protein R3P38DRAFT_2806783 [Favolaschia claudopus]|uniref:Uncharacterized protein n=1 Tax=Favolaschia claudopus TaxID=2862362 RepID=A0AAV9ZIK2_9AGAR